MAHLLLHNGKGTPLRYELTGDRVTIGRHPENSLVLDDASVSGHHAEITNANGVYTVRDLQSANGITMNGRPIGESTLKDNDTISFGSVVGQFERSVVRLVEGRPKKASPVRTILFTVAATISVIFLPIGGLLIFAIWTASNQGEKAATVAVNQLLVEQEAKPSPEEKIASQLQRAFSDGKQALFEAIHPVGTAKSVKVHDVSIRWKEGHPHKDEKDIEQFVVRFTVYWEGPLTTDGYTKATQTYDMESDRWIGGEVISTNGITKSTAAYWSGYVGGVALREWLDSK